MVANSEGPTVVLTGGTGFIGRRASERLLEIAGRLVVLARCEPTVTAKDTVWVTSTLEEVSKSHWRSAGVNAPDVVVHLGAFIPKNQAGADDVSAVYRDNLEGTRNLLESFPSPPRRVIFASTVDVYAATDNTLSEGSALGPSNLYAASKLFCEQLVVSYGSREGSESCILRYGHIYGPGEEKYQKLIPNTIHNLLSGRPPVIYGNGQALRDFFYIDDAAEATVRAAMVDLPELSVINVVSGQSIAVGQLIEKLVELTGYEGEVENVPQTAPERSMRFNNAELRRLLGSWQTCDIAEGLRREVDYLTEKASS